MLADEINRATPKTQVALLEAMQEKQVTAGGQMRPLEEPFFVMATQNPLEQEGTYPLPEAQLDRFFFKLLVQYTGREELRTILDRTTTNQTPTVKPVLDGPKIVAASELVKPGADRPARAGLRHPLHAGDPSAGHLRRADDQPVSPRRRQPARRPGDHPGRQGAALLDGRFHVSFKDIKDVVVPAMRHRIILNFEGEAEGITTDMVLENVIAETPTALDTAGAGGGAGGRESAVMALNKLPRTSAKSASPWASAAASPSGTASKAEANSSSPAATANKPKKSPVRSTQGNTRERFQCS